MASAPIFYHTVTGVIIFALLVVIVAVELAAFVHCVTRRAEGFLAVGNIPKIGWVAMTGLALLVTGLTAGATPFDFSFASIIAMMALVVSLVYLLDVRPALRDAVEGRGNW